MALVGGGGAPNVAGSNPTGTGTGLNYIGDHAYAYSGEVDNDGSSATTALKFTTGNEYVLGQMHFIIYRKRHARRSLYTKNNDEAVYALSLNGKYKR